MAAEGTGQSATLPGNDPAGANPAGTGENTPDPREDALGDKGKELLTELRKENRELAKTVKELQSRFTEQDDAAAKAKADEEAEAERKRKADEDRNLSAAERLERELQAEREERLKFQRQFQERVVRDDFMSRLKTAGIRDEAAAEDLYRIVQSDLTEENISQVIEAQKTQREYFFTEKKGTRGHGGSAGTGGGGNGPLVNADEARFARMAGVKPEDYAKSRDAG